MDERTLVLYDGACRFCRWAIEWIDRLDRHGVLEFCPFGHPVAEAKLSALSAETRYEQMHVVRNGRLVSGTLAARAILRKLPGGRLAVAVGLHRVYPLIVRYRWALGRFSPERLARVTCGERREPISHSS